MVVIGLGWHLAYVGGSALILGARRRGFALPRPFLLAPRRLPPAGSRLQSCGPSTPASVASFSSHLRPHATLNDTSRPPPFITKTQTTQTGVFAREPSKRLIVQGATDTVVISLSGTAMGSAAAVVQRYGWWAFIGLYMCVHGLLLLIALEHVAATRLRARRAAAAAEAAEAEAALKEKEAELVTAKGGGAEGRSLHRLSEEEAV